MPAQPESTLPNLLCSYVCDQIQQWNVNKGNVGKFHLSYLTGIFWPSTFLFSLPFGLNVDDYNDFGSYVSRVTEHPSK